MSGDVPKRVVSETVSFSGRIEAICERFEAAWNTGRAPRIEDYLPDRSDVAGRVPSGRRRQLLLELMMIDLERRWRAAQIQRGNALWSQDPKAGDRGGSDALPDRPLLEDYLRCFPELGPVSQLPDEAIAAEYHVRHRWGDRPEPAEYLRRFPSKGAELSRLLAQGHATAEPTMPPKLGEYRLLEKLGEGGMGVVYKARHTKLTGWWRSRCYPKAVSRTTKPLPASSAR